MNCFHFSVSLGYNTTLIRRLEKKKGLWIAFIFQYLWDTTQHKMLILLPSYSCELLSFFSIFGIQHNSIIGGSVKSLVVNCFHFSVSLGYNTTPAKCKDCKFMLWIAFIFQYLWDTTQPRRAICPAEQSCELLSFFSIFGIQHNDWSRDKRPFSVVNCFHFSVSLGYNTTYGLPLRPLHLLWIAFIFQYLWDTTQPQITASQRDLRCELLSFFSIFGIQHNRCIYGAG